MQSINNRIENKILNYNNIDYLTSKTRFNDYISNKNDIVHKKMYDNALDKYLNKTISPNLLDKYLKTHIFIEIKADEYWKPSKVFIKETVSPYKVYKIDLSEYWNEYQYIDEHKEMNSLFFEEKEDLNGLEVVDINYIKGKAKFRNKYSGVEFWKDFKYLNEDTVYNDEPKSLKNTFTYKLQNKIYGE